LLGAVPQVVIRPAANHFCLGAMGQGLGADG
jgi:hypothetical protein